MLKLFPLPRVLLAWAARRMVNVAVFGNGLSLTEWEALRTSYWRRHRGFIVNLVNDPSQADLLAVHGPLTPSSWPFLERWIEQRRPDAVVLAVGAEAPVREGHLLTPQGEISRYRVHAVLPGHPPTPDALKASLAQLLQAGQSV